MGTAESMDLMDSRRSYHFVEPPGPASIQTFVEHGSSPDDAIAYGAAFYQNYNTPVMVEHGRISSA